MAQAFSAALATQVLAPTPDATFAGVFIYWLLLLAPAGVVVYVAVVGLRTAEVNRAELRARERQAQALAAQLSEAQLGALRAQIQPHFLFNTLNAVIALVRDRETAEAVAALTTLSSLLRTALRTGATHTVTLSEELAFTTNYLAIERMRFGERLCVNMDVDTALGDAKVPSFMLQPFVENALRHGLRQQPQLRVDISARTQGGQMFLRIEDDGTGLPKDWEERSDAAVTVGERRYLVRSSLDALERTLPASAFMRVHRSWIVPRDRIVAIRPSTKGRHREMILKSGTVVPVSRRRQSLVMRLLRGPAAPKRIDE